MLDWIPRVYFINLPHREDRRDRMMLHLTQELGFPVNKITRMEGINDSRHGAVGCLRAHINTLEQICTNSEPFALILEDDAVFNVTDPLAYSEIRSVIESTAFDVFFLSCIVRKSCPMQGNIIRVLTGYCGTAYIVRREYAPTLCTHLKQALLTIDEAGFNHRLALDVFWRPLQKRHQWLCRFPILVVQHEDYSDIRKRRIQYSFD